MMPTAGATNGGEVELAVGEAARTPLCETKVSGARDYCCAYSRLFPDLEDYEVLLYVARSRALNALQGPSCFALWT